MLDVAGFDIYDLGRDVPPNSFVDKAREVGADIIAISTIMTTAVDSMGAVIRKLEEAGIRDSVKVMVGGGPLYRRFAEEIGADGYSANASEAVLLAKKLVGLG